MDAWSWPTCLIMEDWPSHKCSTDHTIRAFAFRRATRHHLTYDYKFAERGNRAPLRVATIRNTPLDELLKR